MKRWLDDGEPFALATLVATAGSTPRAPGAVLLVRPGDPAPLFAGGVSSGCVEHDLIERAVAILAPGRVEEIVYGDEGPSPWVPGLTCGGEVRVRLEPYFRFSPDPVMREIALVWEQFLEVEEPGALLSAGARHLLMMSDGSVLGQRADWPAEALAQALEGVRRGATGGVALGEGPEAIFIRYNQPRPRLVVTGAGEIAIALSQLVESLGVRLVVVDSRPAYVRTARFGGGSVDLRRAEPADAVSELALGPRDAFVALAHDARIDDPALEAAMRSEAGLIGALGSRRSHAQRSERLRERGWPDEALARIRGPVGLWHSGRDPAEIALSILAEWFAARAAVRG